MKNFLFLVICIVVVGFQSCTLEEYQDQESLEFEKFEKKANLIKNLKETDGEEDVE